jgi:Xaa-Pro aminopeptidase
MKLAVDFGRLRKERVEKARKVVKQHNLDAFVATTFENVRYITDKRPFFVIGWMPNSIAVLPKDAEPLYLHPDDFVAQGPAWQDNGKWLKDRYGMDHLQVWPAAIARDIFGKWLTKTLAKLGLENGRIGLDQAPWQWYDEFKKDLPGATIVDAEEAILFERAVKTQDEIALLKKGCRVASKGVEAGLDAVKPGVREYEVYRAFMGELYGNGSEGDGFWPFLTSGRCVQGALYPTNRKIAKGDSVTVDMGPIIQGYNGDCMRTGFAGKPPKEFKDMYRAVYDCMYAVVKTARPGAKTSELSEASRKVIKEYGFSETRFDHGHGVGLSCCELPCIVKKEAYENLGNRDIELKPGMCFSSEPRLFKYLNAKTFIQAALEEVILVTETGREVITSAPFVEELLD